jgi:hypothetical protein
MIRRGWSVRLCLHSAHIIRRASANVVTYKRTGCLEAREAPRQPARYGRSIRLLNRDRLLHVHREVRRAMRLVGSRRNLGERDRVGFVRLNQELAS